MKNQVVGLIAYKVKKGLVDSFQSDIMPEFRKLVSSFGGLVSYLAFNSLERERVCFDQVVWESQVQVSQAIAKFEVVKERVEHEEMMNGFEEVTSMDHSKLVA